MYSKEKHVTFEKTEQVYSQDMFSQDVASQDMFSQSQDCPPLGETVEVETTPASNSAPAETEKEDTIEQIDSDFDHIKDDVMYLPENANVIIDRLKNVARKEQQKNKETQNTLIEMSASNDMLQRKQLDLSSAAGQEFASKMIQSVERRLNHVEEKITSSEVQIAQQFAEQNRILESLVITLSNSKNENLENFTEVTQKLTIIHNTISSSQEALAVTIEHERSATDGLLRRSASAIRSDIADMSLKLLKSPAPKNSTPDSPEILRDVFENKMPDTSKPPPSLKKFNPISSSMAIYNQHDVEIEEVHNRSRSRSVTSRRNARERSRSRSESSRRGDFKEIGRSSDSTRDRSRSRIRKTDGAPIKRREDSRSRDDGCSRDIGRNERSRETSRRRDDSRRRDTSRRRDDSRSRDTSRRRDDSRSRDTDRNKDDGRNSDASRSRDARSNTVVGRSRAQSRPPSRRDPSQSRFSSPVVKREQSEGREKDEEPRHVSYRDAPAGPFRGSSVSGFSSSERDWQRGNRYGEGDRPLGEIESELRGNNWPGPPAGRGQFGGRERAWVERGGQFRGTLRFGVSIDMGNIDKANFTLIKSLNYLHVFF